MFISQFIFMCRYVARTDMRKSFDGLMAIIRDTYQLDPYANNREETNRGFHIMDMIIRNKHFDEAVLIRSPLKMNIRTPADSYKTWIYRSGSWLCTIGYRPKSL